MKRKLMAMTLALMLMLTLAITVSAASISGGGTYEGYGYETYDTCNAKKFSSLTMYDSMDYSIYSNVTVYVSATTESGTTMVVPAAYYYGDPGYTAATTSGSTAFSIASILCEHYINNSRVYSINVYPD